MKECEFFSDHRHCGGKDFLFAMVYSIALPALTLFAFNQNRICATFGAVLQTGLIIGLIVRP